MADTRLRLHIDTDFAGDTDDACAIAMLLGWPGVEIAGITTTADPDGRRAGYLAYLLDLAGRGDIPIAAGGPISLTTGRPMGEPADHQRFWGVPVEPRPSPPGAALDLLATSVETGATILAIGPWTNLAALPAGTGGVPVVAMGGWVHPPAPDLPPWEPDMDWNVQCDPDAAITLLRGADLTLATLTATMRAHLRAADLPRLTASGPVGALLARQALAHGTEHRMADLGAAYAGLPDDLLNFQYDPVAAAVAVGWTGATLATERLVPVREGGVLRFAPDPAGYPVKVLVDVDGPAFAETWLAAVEAVAMGRFGP
jgi:purine nucleosidase